MSLLTCACCGYKTIGERGNWEICPVCFWEDDPVQFRDPDFGGGANKPSLRQAQKNYCTCGACERELSKHVRVPAENDEKDRAWKPLDD
jgi:hypothetical protein